MERKQVQAQHNSAAEQEETQVSLHHQATEVDQELVAGTDDLLNEIDGLLEENSEEFVKGFVQKGGQ
ncbi:ubiquitin-like protein Pup [Rothia sp. LK2588]|uniref:ubiquitin-like protein Pup n=1 Tax=Rothia sp. LK2588 TaxID=3114369 RepID=UPI0034CE9355